jgi:hypothetical protein
MPTPWQMHWNMLSSVDEVKKYFKAGQMLDLMFSRILSALPPQGIYDDAMRLTLTTPFRTDYSG